MPEGFVSVPDNSDASITVKVVDTNEISIISTTLTTAVTGAGIFTVTPASITGIGIGTPLIVDTLVSGVQESVNVLSIVGSSFSAKFAYAHASGVPLVLNVERQNMSIADPTTYGNIAKVASGTASITDIGLTVRPIPTSIPAGTNTIGNVAITSPNGAAAGIYGLVNPYGTTRISGEPIGLFTDTFDGTTFDTVNRWNTPTVVNGGAYSQNNGDLSLTTGLTANAQSIVTSQPNFVHVGSSFLEYTTVVQLESSPIATGCHRYWGTGTSPTVISATNPVQNGYGFEVTTTGTMNAVVYASGTKVGSYPLSIPTDGLPHRYAIIIRSDVVFYYVDNIEVPVAEFMFVLPSVQTLPIRFHILNGTSALTKAPILYAYGVAMSDTAENSSAISDGTYPWRKASVENINPSSSDYGLVTRNIPNSTSNQAIVSNDLSTTGTIQNLNDTVSLTLNGISSWIAELQGTWTGTVQFEASIDGINFVPLRGRQSGMGGNTILSTQVTSTNGYWRGNAAGFNIFRVRAITALTGPATINIKASIGTDAVFLDAGLPPGTDYIGQVGGTTTTYPVTAGAVITTTPGTTGVSVYSDTYGNMRTIVSDYVQTGTLVNLNDTIVVNQNGGYTAWNVSLSGTWTGVVTFEGSVDGTNWQSITGRLAGVESGPLYNSTSLNGVYRGNAAGLQFRVRLSAITSGSVTVTIRLGQGPYGVFLNSALPVGTNNIGSISTSTFPSTGVNNAPGTVGQTLLSDSDGSLRIHAADIYSSGTINTLGATVQIQPVGHATALINIQGSFVGTFQFEVSLDSLTYYPIEVKQVGVSTTTLLTTSNVGGIFRGNIAGALYFRVRATSWTSGSATVYINGSHATAPVFLDAGLPIGTNNLGSTQLADGTNSSQLAKVTSDGAQLVAIDSTTSLPAGTNSIGNVTLNNDLTYTGTILAGTQLSHIIIPLNGANTIGVSWTNNSTNAILQFQASVDGVNYVGIVPYESSVLNSYVSTVSSVLFNGRVSVAGYSYFRISNQSATGSVGSNTINVNFTVSGNSSIVTLVDPIPPGTNAIGTVGVTALPSIPAGGNTIGNVKLVDTAGSNQASVNTNGSLSVLSYNDSTTTYYYATAASANVLVKNGPGRLISVTVFSASTGIYGILFDTNGTPVAGTTTPLVVIPAYAPAGYTVFCDIPFANGLTIFGTGSTGPTYTVNYR